MKQVNTKVKKDNSLPFDYQIRRSKRARKTRIVVSANKVEVVAPSMAAERKIHDFVYHQRDWVGAALKKMQRHRENIVKLAPTHYRDGANIPFKGSFFPLSVKSAASRGIKIEFTEQDGFIAHSSESARSDHGESLRLALVRWMKQQARTEAHRYIRAHAEKHRLIPRSLRIKTQKSRWGSCGVNNDINLNWLLIMAPPTVMEYVVVHELCHIRHRNHSRDFWELVADHLPDYRQRRNWLKQHGQSLMLGL